MKYRQLFVASIEYTDGNGQLRIKFGADEFDDFIEQLKKTVEDIRSHHNQIVDRHNAWVEAKQKSGEDYYGPKPKT